MNIAKYILLLTLLCVCTPLTHVQAQKRGKAKIHLTADQQTKFDYYFYDAVHSMNNGQPDKSLVLLTHCLEIDPQNAAANAMIGNIYIAMNHKIQATEYFKRATQNEPSNWDYRRQWIHILVDNNNTKLAIEETKEAIKIDKKNEEAYRVLAIIQKSAGEYKQAITTLNKLEKAVGMSEYASMEKFQNYLMLGKLTQGMAEIDKLIAENPENSWYKVLRACTLMDQGILEQAHSELQTILAEDPDNQHAYIALADYYKTINNSEKELETIMAALNNDQIDVDTKINMLSEYAEKLVHRKEKLTQLEGMLTTLVEKYPLEERVHHFYAIYLLEKGEEEKAIQTLWTMIDINPKNKATWLEIINHSLRKNDTTAIMQITQQAIQAIPQEPEWYFYLGIAHTQLLQYQEALENYLVGAEKVDDSRKTFRSDFYSQIADLYYLMNEKEKAFEYYEKAHILAVDNLLLLNNYAYHLSLEDRDLKKAENMSAKTVEKEPQNSVYLDTYAWIFYKQDSISLAKFYIERAIDNMTDEMKDPEIWEHYGYILFKSNKIEEAIAAWNRAIQYGSADQNIQYIIDNTTLTVSEE